MKSASVKIYRLLTQEKRRSAAILLFLIIIGTLFEIIGIGLLLPVMVVLADNDFSSNYPMAMPILELFGAQNRIEQIQVVMLILLVVYLIKNLYLAFLAWRQARFSLGVQEELSQRLFSIYIHLPYTFHLQRNSAHLIRNVTGEISQFISNAINPILNLTAEVLVLFGIVGLLLLVEPLGTLSVFFVLLVASLGFYHSARGRITSWGVRRQFHDGQRLQHLHQGLGGVKDAKLLGRESDFLKQFNIHNTKSMQTAQYLEIFQKLPRLWLELLAVVGLTLLVFIMLNQGREISDIIPVMGIFAIAAFRLMPSVSRILVSLQALRYGLPAINDIYNDFQLDSSKAREFHNETEVTKMNKEIRLKGVSYSYPNTEGPAIFDINITIKQGESVGFIGTSGSGKSTLIDVILGLLTPDSGQVQIDKMNIQENLRLWQNQIGYVPQSIYLTDDTLRRNIAFGLPEELIDNEAIKNAISSAQLDEFVSSLANGLDTLVGERGVRLSGGQRQRIGIARALYHNPDVLVLDEATSALDTKTETKVMQDITALRGEKTIIIVAHRLSTVEHCDWVYKLDHGGIEVEKKSCTDVS